ncbi:hypothetical protein O0L34_g6896 [Tuta absoluta]|nr:hypothetical protein O0L34_g6896 [Tuta absoluta]
MQRLKSGEYIHLSDSILKVLAQNRIFTISEFLQEDTEKISALTKLSLPQVLDVRNDIFTKYSAPLVNGATLLVQNVMKRKFISTGIQSLDNIINGGIPTGFITEFCGIAESGKTQLCLQVAINCVKSSEDVVLFVDTKGDFSADRVQKILDATGFSYKDMAQIMFKIKVVHIWTMDEIVEFFKKLKSRIVVIENLALIIIDSLPCLMFQHLGDDNKIGLTFLNSLVNYSRCLCKEMNIGIVCVNIQTRWIDQDIMEDDDAEQSTLPKETYTEKRNRCLGKYWQQIPALVLILEKEKYYNVNFTQVNVAVVQSFNLNCNKKCVLKISNLGVT